MEQEYGRDITYYFDLLKRRFLLLIVPMVLVAGIGTAVVMSLQSTYRAEVTLLVQPQRIPTNLNGESPSPVALNEPLHFSEQRLMTRENLLRVAEQFDLFPAERLRMPPETLAEIMSKKVKIARIITGPMARPDNSPTFFFTIEFDYEDPAVAAKVVEELASFIIREDVQVRASRASETVQVLYREVKELKDHLTSIESRISEFSQRNISALPSRLEFNLTQLEARKAELNASDLAIRTIDDEKKLLDLELRLKALVGNVSTSEVQGVSSRLESLRAQIAERSSIYSDSHPEVRSLKQQMSQVVGQINAGLQDMQDGRKLDTMSLPPDLRLVAERINTLISRREFLTEQRTTTMSSISTLESYIAQAPEVDTQLRALQGQRQVVQRVLDELTPRLAAAEMKERLEKGEEAKRIKLAEQPVVPKDPIKPNRLKLLALVFCISAMAGGGSLLAVDLLDRTIRSSRDLASVVGGFPIVSIPRITIQREVRQRRKRLISGAASLAILVLAGLAALHIYIMPVDLVLQNLAILYDS